MHPLEFRAKALGIVAICYLVSMGLAYYLATKEDPIVSTFSADLLCTLFVFLFSWSFRNTSIYDPYWSVIPIALAIWASVSFGEFNFRNTLLVVAVWVWGTRLTFNWVRRWQGLHDIDWRYRMYEEKMGRWFWPFSLLGLQALPTLIVYMACLPMIYTLACSPPQQSIDILGLLGFVLSFGGIFLEAISDEELHKFKTGKIKTLGKSGVWSLWRFPNYVGEVLFWWGLFLVGVDANPSIGWTIIGPLIMTMLFHFVSMPLMEQRNAQRRPAYYQELLQRPRWIPGLFGKSDQH